MPWRIVMLLVLFEKLHRFGIHNFIRQYELVGDHQIFLGEKCRSCPLWR